MLLGISTEPEPEVLTFHVFAGFMELKLFAVCSFFILKVLFIGELGSIHRPGV